MFLTKKRIFSLIALLVLQANLAIAAEEPVPMIPPTSQERPNLKSPETRDKLISQAFKLQMDMMLPLEPESIAIQKNRIEETEKTIRPTKQPTMTTGSVQLILEPNSPIPVVNLTPGYVTALAFYDVTGAPWPLTSAAEGNSEYFSMARPEGLEPGNMITVQSLQKYASSNLIVTLADFSLPVVIHLKTTDLSDPEKPVKTNSVISFRATKQGPLANDLKVGKPIESPVSEQLMSFLDGIPPKKAERIEGVSQHPGMDMWRYNGFLFLRTQLPLIWPAYDHIINGSEGITLYRLPEVASIMVSDSGNNITFDVNR